ncbi:hypothetical protein EOM89_10545 [Candidatus Falkowbacteria bacterium]|jgi:NADH:ubiquinone oxidoreductase subunit E|nr:hypothetical protein [Candidatus Falkowbacteria bacterium]
MEKIKVEVCCGTACYLLGAAKMMNLEDQLPEKCRGRVEVEAKPCLELCEKDNLEGAPYVRFNETEVMGRATPERVVARICQLIEGIA